MVDADPHGERFTHTAAWLRDVALKQVGPEGNASGRADANAAVVMSRRGRRWSTESPPWGRENARQQDLGSPVRRVWGWRGRASRPLASWWIIAHTDRKQGSDGGPH